MSRRDATVEVDLCVVGGGTAGVAAALTGVALGARVALIERDGVGGARLAEARMEALRAIAARAAATTPARGRDATQRLWDEARRVGFALGQRAAAELSARRLAAAGVLVVSGHARFAGPDELWAGATRIGFRRAAIATGRVALAPRGGPGLDIIRGLTPQELLALPEAPESVAVLGGDALALEFAQALGRLGIAVVVIAADRALADFPEEAAAVALRRLRGEGARIVEHAEVVAAEPFGPDRAARLSLSNGETVEVSHVAFAQGTRAALDGLGLESAGVAADAEGVRTRADLRSVSHRRVYAAGGAAAGAFWSRGGAERSGRLAARRALLPLAADARLDLEPRIARTDPEIVCVGRAEATPGSGLRALRAPFGDDDRAHAGGRTDGHATLIVDARGRLLGATLVGPQASEAAALMALAIEQGLDAARLAATPLPSPTLAATLARAAAADLARLARAPATGRLMAIARWLR